MEYKLSQDLPDYSIAIVNYKTAEVTKICLELLEKVIDVSKTPVWVVDNNSGDESLDLLKSNSWIHLIERKPIQAEEGFMAHGRALDLILAQVKTKYLLLIHTDTLIYDAKIIYILLEKMVSESSVMAVGCLEQVKRTWLETVWRYFIRAIKYYTRKLKRALGFKTRDPRLYYEIYLKSFCTLWNADLIKQYGFSFAMTERIPGYEIQDRLRALGYKTIDLPAREMFKYLDHIEAGTVSLVKNLDKRHKRVKNYQNKISEVKSKLWQQ